MHSSDVNRIRRELRQLVFGIQDMRLAREAAESLIAGTGTSPRILETGMVVAYCRAFSEDAKRRVPITATMLPEGADRDFHDSLLRLRDTVYAHSDETPNRVLVDPFADHNYTEAFRPWKSDSLVTFVKLARQNENSFETARQERQNELRAAGVPADPTIT